MQQSVSVRQVSGEAELKATDAGSINAWIIIELLPTSDNNH